MPVPFVYGAGGVKQLRDRAATDPTIVALRAKVKPVVSPGITPAQVDMTIVTKDGRTLHKYIQHAIGSVEVPMTNKQLEVKFADLAEGIIPADQARKVMDMCWKVETLQSAGDIAKAGATA